MTPAILAAAAGGLVAPEIDDALRAELERGAAELRLGDAPPIYHLRYHLLTLDQVDVEASLGSPIHTEVGPVNGLGVEVRVGGPGFDNTGFGGWQNGFALVGLPAALSPHAARLAAWRATDGAYKEAVEQFARKQAQFVPPDDHPGDYTLTGPVVHEGGTAGAADAAVLEPLAVALSAALVDQGSPLVLGTVRVGHEAGQVLVLDTEGTRVVNPVHETTIRALAHLRAADGMLLTDHRLWTVRDPTALPDRPAMIAEVRAMGEALRSLASVPALDEEYVGPVILEDLAAVDLFRYLLVPQLEGTPEEIPFDSYYGEIGDEKDPVRVGRRVLPPGWTAVDDPTRDPAHPGAFTHDNEGTPAEAVTLVEDGIVRTLLMSRVPRRGIGETNGHARGAFGARAQGRVSQLEITPARRVSTRKLHDLGLRAARSYGRDFVIVIRRLQEPAVRNADDRGGFFFFGGDEGEAALPPPLEVVRLYADGREERLRGATFTGVQRFLLRDILAAGPPVEASFMAPGQGGYSGLGPTEGLATWIGASSLLVGEAELVPAPGDPREVPALPALETR